MTFQQRPPELGNQYDDDRVLRSYLERVLGPDVLSEIEESLREMGELSSGELYQLQAIASAPRFAQSGVDLIVDNHLV